MTARDDGEHRCTTPTCTIDWLLDPDGPNDPAWMARVAADARTAPSLVGGRWKRASRKPVGGAWSIRYQGCINCGTTETRHIGNGRCSRCHGYWHRRGVERPIGLTETSKSA